MYHRSTGSGTTAVSGHSWLYCRLKFGYQAPRVSRSRRISNGESRLKALFDSHWSRTGRKRDNRNGSSDCFDPAVFGPGADRGRNVGGAIFGRTGVSPAATAESSRSASTESGAGSEAGTCGTARSTDSTGAAGSTWTARTAAGGRRPATTHVFAVDESLRQGAGHPKQAGLRHYQGWSTGKRHAGRDCPAVRA